jgi:uncharacterized membrane protein
VAFGLALAVVALAVLPAALPLPWREALMTAFAPACHQLPARSPHLGGVQLAVCHRCLGTYVGLAAGVVAFLGLRRWDAWLHRHAAVVLGAALAPAAVDWLAPWLGALAPALALTNTPLSRSLTGAVLGVALGYFAARAGVRALARPMQGRPMQGGPAQGGPAQTTPGEAEAGEPVAARTDRS